MPRFSETGHDLVLCQICGRDVDTGRETPRWRIDVTGSRNAGNVCPSCLRLHEETGLVGETLRERAGLSERMRIGAVPVIHLADRLAKALPCTVIEGAVELGVSYRQVQGAALRLVRAGRARYWRGRIVPVQAHVVSHSPA